jgi:transcriptional regulator GlxA family with amidase domain
VEPVGLHVPARGRLPPRALLRVREYITSHLEDSISIQAMAAIVGLSMYHFSRAFKQSEGVTPHRFLMQCRVKRAQELLAGTDLPLSEIALATGFSDQSHCARRVREFVGVTPSRYRWSMR